MICVIRKVDSAPQIQSTGCLGDVVFVALVRNKGRSESARSIIKIALQGDSFCCRVNFLLGWEQREEGRKEVNWKWDRGQRLGKYVEPKFNADHGNSQGYDSGGAGTGALAEYNPKWGSKADTSKRTTK